MISCKEYVALEKVKLKNEIKDLKRSPKLYIFQVGNDDASNRYTKWKKKDCEEVGIEYEHILLPESVTTEELLMKIEIKQRLWQTDAVIVQLPLPKHIDVERVTESIYSRMDVDGFTVGSPYDPCTPKGIIDWLEYNNIDFNGKVCAVLGRSKIVGKPLVNMLIDRGATVINCNSKTNHDDVIKTFNMSEIVISAIGKPRYWERWDFLNTEATEILVDVGINTDENGELCGDFDERCVEMLVGKDPYQTPVPGSVGLLTRLSLLKNVVKAYEVNPYENRD